MRPKKPVSPMRFGRLTALLLALLLVGSACTTVGGVLGGQGATAQLTPAPEAAGAPAQRTPAPAPPVPAGGGTDVVGLPLTIPDPARLRRDALALLPEQVGAFRRARVRGGRRDASAEYRSGSAFVELRAQRLEDAASARAAVDAWRQMEPPPVTVVAHDHGLLAWTATAACWSIDVLAFCARQHTPADDAAPFAAFLAGLGPAWRR